MPTATRTPLHTLTGDVTGGPPVAGVLPTVIGPLKVLTGMLADDSVSTIKIQNLAVTTGKLADLSVTNPKIANASINNVKISAIAAISLSKLQFMTDGTVVGSFLGSGGSVPQELNGLQLIDIIEGALGGPIMSGTLDPTLVAFGALTIAGNSITIGTGADAFTQLTLPANTFPARSSIGNVTARTVTNFALGLLDDVDAAEMKVTLGLVIGTNVQAYDADLTTWAAVTPAAGMTTFISGASSAALHSALTTKTGSGLVVFDTSPTITTPTLSGSGFGPGASVVVSGTNDGVQMQSMMQASLPAGSRNFFSLGRAWGSGTACFLGYCYQSTAGNQSSTIGFWGDYGVFTVFKDGGAIVGAQTSGVPANPGANRFVIANSLTPGSAGATGVTGTIAWDSSYLYVCTGTNTWRRVAHATW